MRRRLERKSSTQPPIAPTTDSEWSDVEERTAHRAVIFKQKVDDGAAACARGDFVSALRLYEDAIRLDPTNHVLYTNRSAIFCKLGRYEEALKDAEKSYALNPEWTKAFYRKGYALKSMGKNVAALTAYASGLAQDSKNWQLLSGLIECISESDMKDGFVAVYNELKYLGLEKSPYVIISVVGQELLNAGFTTDAINVLECAVKIGTTSMKLRQSVLSALSTAYYNVGDWEKARNFMEQDLSVATALGDVSGEARTHGNLGMLALALNKQDDALKHYQRQLQLSMQLDDKVKTAMTLSMLGQVRKRLFDFESALSYHLQCLDILQEIMETGAPAQSPAICQQYGYIGDVHFAQGDLAEAEKWYSNHWDLARCINLRSEEIKALTELATVDQTSGATEEAVKRFSAALKLAKEEKLRPVEASLSCRLCTIYESSGKLETARRWADHGLAVALSINDRHIEAKACGHLASLEMKNGCVDNAKKLYRRALDMAAKIGDSTLRIKAYRGLGACCFSTGEHEEALRYHQNELQASRESCDKISEATAHGNLGSVYSKMNNREAAESHFLQQAKLAEDTKNDRMEMNAAKNLGLHYAAGGEQNEKAVEFFEKYLMLAQEKNDMTAEQDACAGLGNTHFALKHYKEAARYYDQALSLAKYLRDHGGMARAYCQLGLVRLAMDQLNEALECQKYYLALAHIINDSQAKLSALNNIGRVLLKNKKAPLAAKVFAKQLTLAKTCDSKQFQASAYGQLGLAYDAMGKNGKALAFYLQELTVCEAQNDLPGQYEAHGRIGDHYRLENHVTLAVRAAEDQLRLARRMANSEKETAALRRIAEIYADARLFETASQYFYEIHRLQPSNYETALDCARCLKASSDDVSALTALENGLRAMNEANVFGKESSAMYREQGCCFFRLKNYRRAFDAFESALDYSERTVVDACFKSDCYRYMAAAELACGRPDSAVAQLNRRLQFLRSVGFTADEPKARCDLAFALCQCKNYALAADVADAALSTSKNVGDFESEYRAVFLMALSKDAAGDFVAAEKYLKMLVEITTDRHSSERILTATALRASVLLNFSPAEASQLTDRALLAVPGIGASHLVAFINLLSALRHWAQSNIKDAQDSFMSILTSIPEFSEANAKDLTDDPPLFDQDLWQHLKELCLSISLVFFASQKMDEKALTCAEMLRFSRFKTSLKAACVQPTLTEKSFNDVFELVLNRLDNLDAPVLYFVQIEDVMLTWTLTAGFRMSTVHRINTAQLPEDLETECIFVPLLPTCLFTAPTYSLAQFAKRLIFRNFSNQIDPDVTQPYQIFDRALRTVLSHEKRAPIVVGCQSIFARPPVPKSMSFVEPIFQVSLLPLEDADDRKNDTKCTPFSAAILLGACRAKTMDTVVSNILTEKIDAATLTKSEILDVFRRFYWVHFAASWRESEEGFLLKPVSSEDSEENDDDEDTNMLTIEDILAAKISAPIITIEVENFEEIWPTKRLLDAASAFLVSGANAVLISPPTPVRILEKFYQTVIGGSPVKAAVDAVFLEGFRMENGKNFDCIFFARDANRRCSGTAQLPAAFRTLLGTPEDCREALRVVLHLIEKSLQRIQAGSTTAMFTSEQSVRNKAGPEVRGCIELLSALGFRRPSPNSSNGPVSNTDALYFPATDVDGALAIGSAVVQALLGLPQNALFAFSKLTSMATRSYGDVLTLFETLNSDVISPTALQYEATVANAVWSVSGVPELLASLGFDKMREIDNNAVVKTIRMELTRKKLTLALTCLHAIFGDYQAHRRQIDDCTIEISQNGQISSHLGKATFSISTPRRTENKLDLDAGELSGLESDFSFDASLMSVVALAKRNRSSINGLGKRKGKRRGNGGKMLAVNSGGYLSEGDVKDNARRRQTARGYCSDDDGASRREKMAPESTAQVISVDERASPVSDGEDRENAALKNCSMHEYARLETPTIPPHEIEPACVVTVTGPVHGLRVETLDSTYGEYRSSSIRYSYSPRFQSPNHLDNEPYRCNINYGSPAFQSSPRQNSYPPPYHAITAVNDANNRDLFGPPAMRKAAERYTVGQQQRQIKSPPPSYASVSISRTQYNASPRLPPPYGLVRERERNFSPAGH